MHFYAYRGTGPVGTAGEPLGTSEKILTLHHEYRTIRGFMRYAIPRAWRGSRYWVYTFTNFYDRRTFTLIHRNDGGQ